MEITVILIIVYIFFYFSSRKESNAFDKALADRQIEEDKAERINAIKRALDPFSVPRESTVQFGNKFMSAKDKKVYMRSNVWKVRKLATLIIQNSRCKLCDSPYDLHLHHLTYERLGNEYQSDLVVLCGQCHQRQHDHYGYDRTTDYSVLIKPKQAE